VRSRTDDSDPGAHPDGRASTGIRGLDDILGGGLPRNRLYLIDGEPGTGKTTLGLQFLLAGREAGERLLYVTLSESADELRASAAAHGWSLDGIEIFELSAVAGDEPDEAYTLFHPAEVELQQTVSAVFAAVERSRPARAVFDSLSEMRMLARDPLRFRRQILALKQFFAGGQCTVLLLDDRTGPANDLQLQSIAHGVVALEYVAMDYGAERRRIHIKKLRGAPFRGGYHDFRIRTGGMEVFPRIAKPSRETHAAASTDVLRSGTPELDALLGGGLTCGTSALITGAAGTGKSTLAMQFARAAIEQGDRALVVLFDERVVTALQRARGLALDIDEPVAAGRLTFRQVEPTELSPGEFAHMIVRAVDEDGVTLVVIDSLNGYLQSMPNERLLSVQVHELLSHLASRGVTVLMTLVQRGIFGSPVDDAAEVSYLADAVVLLRYFEHAGVVRKAISVVKRRSGRHEETIREFRIDRGGLQLGEPLEEFRGVLTGVPEYVGDLGPLMDPARAGVAGEA
jgi:circadian clock protein KaiC